jgi:hypothetical protein
MAITATKIEDLQKSLKSLTWAEENGLRINPKKSALMIFRKGGRVAEKLKLGTENLGIVNEYKYLGITMQTSGNSFNRHVRQKAITATAAMRDIRHTQSIFLYTAMKIFRAKIVPILTYRIHGNT